MRESVEDRADVSSLRETLKSPFIVIPVLALFGACAGIPYYLDYIRITSGYAPEDLSSLGSLASDIFLQLFVPAVIAALVGLLILRAYLPWVFRYPLPGPLERNVKSPNKSDLILAILTGLLLGGMLTILTPISNYFITGFSGSETVYLIDRIAPWKGLLASFSAGIIEELEFRLCLLTFFAWIGTILLRTKEPNTGIFWAANLLAIIPFGLMHLRNVVAAGGIITPAGVAMVLLGNGICGLAFGALYLKKGLANAITAHIVMDIVLYALIPFFLLL